MKSCLSSAHIFYLYDHIEKAEIAWMRLERYVIEKSNSWFGENYHADIYKNQNKKKKRLRVTWNAFPTEKAGSLNLFLWTDNLKNNAVRKSILVVNLIRKISKRRPKTCRLEGNIDSQLVTCSFILFWWFYYKMYVTLTQNRSFYHAAKYYFVY